MATSDSFLMDSLSDSLLAAVTETSFHGSSHPSVVGKVLYVNNEFLYRNSF